jgi:uncharacterized phage infection (PIP) family protein YhgE
MGIMKDMKDMKNLVANAPDMIEEAQKMAANAQQQAQQQAAALQQQQSAAAAAPATGPDFEPVAGVTIELFAEVSKGLAEYNYDQAMAPQVASSKGIAADAWQTAADTWNDRIKANPAVAQRFNALYTGKA